jgi:hypothetical protein
MHFVLLCVDTEPNRAWDLPNYRHDRHLDARGMRQIMRLESIVPWGSRDRNCIVLGWSRSRQTLRSGTSTPLQRLPRATVQGSDSLARGVRDTRGRVRRRCWTMLS